MSLKLVDPVAELNALAGGLVNPLQGAFHREELRDVPELAAVYDRYLSQASWEDSPEGIVVVAPTSFHVQSLQRLQISIERLLGRPVARFECRRVAPSLPLPVSSPETESKRRVVIEPHKSPSAGALERASARQMFLNPEGLNKPSNPLDAERKRRLEPPPFVRSPSFETPYQLARRWAVSINEGQRGQALWVHGRPGAGKTTLLKQFHEWIALSLRIESTDVMKFFHEWRRSLEAKDHLSFVRKYRKEVDVLILENIDELQGKIRTQQEVLFTINAILDGGGSIAVSSVKHPLELKELLEPALYSRLFSGLLLDMPRPDRQFKERLWRQHMEEFGLAQYALDIMMQERLLNIPVDTARQTKTLFINAIGRLSLKRALSISDVGELEAMHTTTPVLPAQAQGRNPSEVIEKVARLCGVGRAAIVGKVKRQDISLARRFVCLALSRHLGLTNCMIAHLVEKDPSTVSHALKTIEQDLQTNRNIAEQWNWICSQLGMPIDTQLPS